ncbi:MAG TPA: FAD binding domain-containing protein [Planctomycetota bacterium]|jgi:4-hydroxybenzoyl-CoA reductase subunit beta|nr:FAD binding domain-containing protein [Planctomycetota bacterium]
MMRLPPFRYLAPRSTAEALRMIAAEGPRASFVAGGTDLYPNMKRRHQTPKTLVALRRLRELRGVRKTPEGGLRIGPGMTLSSLERERAIRRDRPALWSAIHSISTPILRNMGTIGGNVLLDTRCNYYDQSYEWRRAIHFCMKCDGETCWVAPGSDRCLAVQSSDTAPVLCALGARVRFASPRGEREIPIDALFEEDGIRYLRKEPDELLTDLLLPPAGGVRATYSKLRRREAFDFPVLGVATALRLEGEVVREARIFLGAVASSPVRASEAEKVLVGERLTDEAIAAAAERAYGVARPLDNTDFEYAWRKRMTRVFVRDALRSLREEGGG